jgi:hypothetical protein
VNKKVKKGEKNTPTENVNDSETKNFITYFQSVTTIGIVSRAKSAKEAEEKSSKKLANSEISCGLVNQTPYEIGGTDEWKVDCKNSNVFLKNK